MNQGRTVFSQLVDFLATYQFHLSFRASGPRNFMKIPGRQATSKAGDRGIYAGLEQKPQAVHVERHR